MEHFAIYSWLPDALLPWFKCKKRDLPWRKDREPYHIWLSEIMLQQTRVEAVKGYYTRFLKEIPTIEALAEADDEQLRKLWEGLGYYSRVKNLKKAARIVLEIYGGVFPVEYEDVLSLPGVGEYTAGAICSIAYNMKTPAVDGNVLRVISRLTNDDRPVDTPAYKKHVQEKLAAIYPEAAGEFTQALMELGATVCGPNRAPICDACPCASFCEGHRRGTAETLPVRLPKRNRKFEDLTVLILECDGYYALERRPGTGLLASMWQFPNVSEKKSVEDAIAYLEEKCIKPTEVLLQLERKHIFTHIEWNMRGIYMKVAEKSADFEWFSAEQIQNQMALPTAFRQFWEELKNV